MVARGAPAACVLVEHGTARGGRLWDPEGGGRQRGRPMHQRLGGVVRPREFHSDSRAAGQSGARTSEAETRSRGTFGSRSVHRMHGRPVWLRGFCLSGFRGGRGARGACDCACRFGSHDTHDSPGTHDARCRGNSRARQVALKGVWLRGSCSWVLCACSLLGLRSSFFVRI